MKTNGDEVAREQWVRAMFAACEGDPERIDRAIDVGVALAVEIIRAPAVLNESCEN